MNLHTQPQNSGGFANASTISIEHGIFNNIKGDSYTYHINTYSNVCSHPLQVQTQRPFSSQATYITDETVGPGPSSSVLPCTKIRNPGLFPVIENTLQLIAHLVEAPKGSRTLFHRLSPDLRDIVRLVSMSSAAYQACDSRMPIGRFIRGAIDGRLSVCNQRLVDLHQEMFSLPHRSVPLMRSVCRALHQWWTANEPEEITSIRSHLNAEITAFGQWLLGLRL